MDYNDKFMPITLITAEIRHRAVRLRDGSWNWYDYSVTVQYSVQYSTAQYGTVQHSDDYKVQALTLR